MYHLAKTKDAFSDRRSLTRRGIMMARSVACFGLGHFEVHRSELSAACTTTSCGRCASLSLKSEPGRICRSSGLQLLKTSNECDQVITIVSLKQFEIHEVLRPMELGTKKEQFIHCEANKSHSLLASEQTAYHFASSALESQVRFVGPCMCRSPRKSVKEKKRVWLHCSKFFQRTAIYFLEALLVGCVRAHEH